MDLLAWGWCALKTALKQSWHESLSLWGMHSDMYTDQPSVLERKLCWQTSFGVWEFRRDVVPIPQLRSWTLPALGCFGKCHLRSPGTDPSGWSSSPALGDMQVLYLRGHASVSCCREQKAGERWADLNVFEAWKPAAAPSRAPGASNHVHRLASQTSREGGGQEVLREEEPSACTHLLWEHREMWRHHQKTYLEHIQDNWNNKCGKVFQLNFERSVWCCEERGVSVMWKGFPFPQ